MIHKRFLLNGLAAAAFAATLALPALVSAIDSQWLQSSYQGGENPPGWQGSASRQEEVTE